MLKEALEYMRAVLKESTAPMGVTVDGRAYYDRPLIPMTPPDKPAVQVSTLQGLVDLISVGVGGFSDEDAALVVEGPGKVALKGMLLNDWGQRTVYASAVLEQVGAFQYGQFMPAEDFAIALQAKFAGGADLDYVARMASNLTAEAVTISDDDGVSQKVATRQGVVLANKETIKRRVTLAPYRTFRELEQPASEFIFRVKQQQHGEPPWCALFEADGGAWKIEAIARIKAWLDAKETTLAVVA